MEARNDEMLFQGDFHDLLQIRRVLCCRLPFISDQSVRLSMLRLRAGGFLEMGPIT